MHPFIHDLAHARRSLWRDRGVFLAAVLCLALGIGTQTVALKLVDTLLLQPPPGVSDASDLHRLYATRRDEGVARTIPSLPYPAIAALGEADVFEGVTGYFTSPVPVEAGGAPRQHPAVFVSSDYFEVLGVHPRRGRSFSATESRMPTSAAVVMISHGAAERFFGTASRALGRSLRIAKEPYAVIGVLPEGFQGVDLEGADLFLPMGTASKLVLSPGWHESTGAWFLNALVRSGGGEGSHPSDRAASLLRSRLGQELGVTLGPLPAITRPGSPISATLFVGLAVLAGLVLLIACLNVASLFLVRHLRRRGELGVRMALGAGRRDLWRLMLAESTLVASIAGVLGIGVTLIEGRLLRHLILPDIAALATPALGRVVVITLLLVAITSVLCVVIPTLRLRGKDIVTLLKAIGKGDRLSGRLEEGLLIFQVAFATVCFISVGWFLASLWEIGRLDLGLDPDRVAVATITMDRGEPEEERSRLYEAARSRVAGLPAVREVALAAGVPLASSFGVGVSLPGRPTPELPTGGPYINAVSADFFATLGTSVVRGRAFRDSEVAPDAPPVVLVNETMASRFWPDGEAMGRCLGVGETECARVVGVVENARRSGLREEPTFQLYVPLAQAPAWIGSAQALFARLPAGGEADALIRDALQTVAGERLVEVRRLDSYLERDLRPFRLGTSLLALFALLALVLIILGIYAASARVVSERTREIGVRMALGAGRAQVIRLIAHRMIRYLLPGLVLGLLLALVVGRFAEPILFNVETSDLRVLVLSALCLLMAGLVATLLPTSRALSVSPSEALRVE